MQAGQSAQVPQWPYRDQPLCTFGFHLMHAPTHTVLRTCIQEMMRGSQSSRAMSSTTITTARCNLAVHVMGCWASG